MRKTIAYLMFLAFAAAGCSSPQTAHSAPAPGPVRESRGALPRPAHVVVVIEENHTLAQVIESPGPATYLQQLARSGALFTNAHGVTHPSQPNYLALFVGVTNTNGDGCPPRGYDSGAPNLASELIAKHLTFAAFSEGLPSAGSDACTAGPYARKHNPAPDFTNVPPSANLPLTSFGNFQRLPTVAFVVPNVDDDMHDGTVAQADAWARAHIAPLVSWAKTHDTLVIFTWDEGFDATNSIPLLLAGPMVKSGTYAVHVDHYDVLRTLEAMYGLPLTGRAASAHTIVEPWK